MNGVQFRRGLVLVGIKSGLDLGGAVAAAKDADAWCAAGGTEDVLTGGAMPDVLALPSPAVETPNTAAGLNGGDRASSSRSKGRRAPARGQSTRPAPAAPRSKAAAASAETRSEKRAKLLRRVLADAGRAGVGTSAIAAAGVGSQPTVTKLLKAAVAAGEVERLGPVSGVNVRWRLASPAKKSVVTRENQADRPNGRRPKAVDRNGAGGAKGVSARDSHTRSDPAGGRATRADEPARESATKPAGGSIPPAGGSTPASSAAPAFNPAIALKVQSAVMLQLGRGPADAATLAAVTAYPRADIDAALEALRVQHKAHRLAEGKWGRAAP